MVVSLCIVGAPGELVANVLTAQADVTRSTGLIGQRHTQHARDEPNVQLTCIVDPTPAGSPFAEKCGVELYRSIEEMLAARGEEAIKVDAAILAVRHFLVWSQLIPLITLLLQTPNTTHVPLGIQLVKAGIHTLVEKPVSTDVDSGKALLAAEAASSARILVGHHRRFVRGVWLPTFSCGLARDGRSRLTFATFRILTWSMRRSCLTTASSAKVSRETFKLKRLLNRRVAGTDSDRLAVLAVQGTWACLKVRLGSSPSLL